MSRLKSVILGAVAPTETKARKVPTTERGQAESTLRALPKSGKRRRKTPSSTLLRDP